MPSDKVRELRTIQLPDPTFIVETRYPARRDMRAKFKVLSPRVRTLRSFRKARPPLEYWAKVARAKINRMRQAGMTEDDIHTSFPGVEARAAGTR